MDQAFPLLVRPLLEGLLPASVCYGGTDVPLPLVRFCRRHDIDLRSTPGHGCDAEALVLDGRVGVSAVRAHVTSMDAPPRLVVVHDAEHGLVGTAEKRAEAIRDAVMAALPDSAFDGRIVPGFGGLVIVASHDAIPCFADDWAQLETSPRVRRLVEEIEQASGNAASSDVAALRRLVERQDRIIADLRQRVRHEEALERQVERLEHQLERLQARRSVRTVLRLAESTRPLFKLKRGQITFAELIGRSPRHRTRRDGHAGSPQPLRTHEFTSTDTGRFYDVVRPVVETGTPEFEDRWAASEEALRTRPPRPAGRETPLVSIIMPTYNRAHLLVEAIETITDQTYVDWELLVCDDGSEDETQAVVAGLDDERIRHLDLPHAGAAAARNAGLAESRGVLIAYLDTDNLWHPRFLEVMVDALVDHPGRHMAYAKYVDLIMMPQGATVKKYRELPFDYERLTQQNFVDLNAIVHRRVVYERYGGFNEALARQQDWDLVLKYAFLRDPLYIDRFLTVYRRNESWGQITDTEARNTSTQPIIEASVASYYRDGLPTNPDATRSERLSVISWDICRNHFSKAYNVAEALTADDPRRAQLVGFRFFEDEIFPPYSGATPAFDTLFLDGGPFPGFDEDFARAVAGTRGDVVYAVKPRLPSLGVALLANYHFGCPVVLETNDLESVVTSPEAGQQARTVELSQVDPADPRLLDPYGSLWTEIMEGLAHRVPFRATHNHVLDDHFGGGAFYVRNPKDDQWFDPDRYDREAVRRDLDIAPEDRVLLFGGMVRRHKGVFAFADLLERLGDEWRLMVVGSRETPDQQRLRDRMGDRLHIVPPVDRNGMARVNLAADAVVLWLDPDVPASHYQMPYKLTDALAMRVPVIANPIGELADLGQEGYLRLVPYGDDDALASALDDLFVDRSGTEQMVDAGRRLYLRQFSYRAVRETLELILASTAHTRGALPVAEEFARFFAAFRRARAGAGPGAGVGA